ncbi:MAG: gluconokinase [Firmicutes bacterium]|nr:gluconokinase [Bacillota bacterium]
MSLDIGTTSTRAMVFDQEFNLFGSASEKYPVHSPQPGWAEQDPDEIYEACIRSIAGAVLHSGSTPNEIRGIAISSVLHSLFAVDQLGRPLSSMLIWADTRSTACVRIAEEEFGAHEIYRRTGCRVHPMYPLAKVMWFRREAPELFARTSRFFSIKDYVLFRMTGQVLADVSVASGTCLFNIYTMDWDDDLLGYAGIDRDMLPQVTDVFEQVSPLLPEAASATGLFSDTPVIIGAADGMLSNIGAGAVEPGQMSFMIGTSGALRVFSQAPVLDLPSMRTWCYVFRKGAYVPGGSINNGGIALDWVQRVIGESPDPGREAASVPPGSEGLIFLPLITGERCPHWRGDARGVMFGLELAHTRAHFIRAAMEGVIYRMYSVYRALSEVVGEPEEVRATGGFVNSPEWVQMAADTLGRPVSVPAEREGSALGAAVVGMAALGAITGVEEVRNAVTITRSVEPDMTRHRIYSEGFSKFEKVYERVSDLF